MFWKSLENPIDISVFFFLILLSGTNALTLCETFSFHQFSFLKIRETLKNEPYIIYNSQ